MLLRRFGPICKSTRRCLFTKPKEKRKDLDLSVISVLEMFSIGVGPSSSHTVGPMKAAYAYTQRLNQLNLFNKVDAVKTQLYGSLAMTGEGHGTPKAVLMGLEGHLPHNVDPTIIPHRVIDIRTQKKMLLGGTKNIRFENDMLQLRKDELLPFHSNGIKFTALDKDDQVLDSMIYYSIGGGFVVDEEESKKGEQKQAKAAPPYMYHTGEELLNLCKENNMTIAQLQMKNEISFGKPSEVIEEELLKIWRVMNESIERGIHSKEKFLPGGLHVRRRAPEIFQRLENLGSDEHEKVRQIVQQKGKLEPFGQIMDWISLYALSVNEENAAGGRVVTAPTNGAAGVIPAVLRYWIKWGSGNQSTPRDVIEYLLTAGTIGILFKKGASISAAEVGCQGEIGVACSMAAGGLCALYGGNVVQILNAAEIGMEHNLGMTCDPVGGLVQIPCIERNTMGSIKAVNAARLAVLGGDDGTNVISLDTVIETMMKTGKDMHTKYKETSTGGLAVHTGLSEC